MLNTFNRFDILLYVHEAVGVIIALNELSRFWIVCLREFTNCAIATSVSNASSKLQIFVTQAYAQTGKWIAR